jgi:DNA (cytosine-5)-methyltransferase 1
MNAYYNENDPFAAAWLRNLIARNLIAPGHVDERSIVDVRPSDLAGFRQCHFFAGIGGWSHALRRAGWRDDRAVWTGSCPCQPFSQAGQGKGIADERHLWPAFFHLIGECRPLVVLGEQVANPAGLAWLDLVQSDLEATDYAVGAVDICAAGIGAPHIRQRLYWMAHADELVGGQGRSDIGGLALGGDARSRPGFGSGGGAGVMAHGDGNGRDQEGEGGRASGHDGALGNGPACVMGNSERAGLAFGPLADDVERALRVQGATFGASEPLRGFWRGADWIWCRDGKYRPVESGTFPLANGAPARVGRLRGYGNAIVAPLAQAFIEAVMDVIPCGAH